ncbi:MAG TPA: TetR/AcrR family transcriptional regulator [Phototrophicaceae bacterium]|nr:TetR/AcrR family transcriptional regulator [Phototrophicaceae bacterium]
MTQSPQNLRIRRTQKLLREALIDLIEEHGFEALTVGQITERALVSRAAFYRNYRDKYDLVEQIFEEAMGKLTSAVTNHDPERPPEVWVKFFEHIAAYARLYGALLGSQGSPWFVMKMRASLEAMVRSHERDPNRTPPLAHALQDGYLLKVLSAFYVESITWWLEQGQPYTPRDMATRCALVASAIFREASSWQ